MPAVTISPVAQGQVFNNSGKPLAGGKVFTYAGGSFSTLKTAYADAAGTIALPNPVTADASGRVPAIWLVRGDTYNIVLTASDGTTVMQQWANVKGVDAVAGASQLSQLTDVTLTSPTNGQVLSYNGTDWVNRAQTVPALSQLTDVTLTSPTNGQVLSYNGTRWVNQASSGGVSFASLSLSMNPLGVANGTQYTDWSISTNIALPSWLTFSGSNITLQGGSGQMYELTWEFNAFPTGAPAPAMPGGVLNFQWTGSSSWGAVGQSIKSFTKPDNASLPTGAANFNYQAFLGTTSWVVRPSFTGSGSISTRFLANSVGPRSNNWSCSGFLHITRLA